MLKSLQNLKCSILLLCCCVLSNFYIHAQNFQLNPKTSPLIPSFTLSLGLDYKTLTLSETVWSENALLSELIWTTNGLINLELGTSLLWNCGLRMQGSANFALHANKGQLTDSDWLNKPTAESEKTHYSVHNTRLDSAYFLDCTLGWQFDLYKHKKKLFFTPSLGFNYTHWSFIAFDGYLQYPPESTEPYSAWTPSRLKTPFYGDGIQYTQQLYIPYIEGLFSYSLNNNYKLFLGFKYSLFVSCYALDHHITRNLYFHDLLYDGILYEPSIAIEQKINAHLASRVIVQYASIGNLRGSTATQIEGRDNYYWSLYSSGNGGGASVHSLSLKMALYYTF